MNTNLHVFEAVVCSNLCLSLAGSSGGICEKSKLYSDGKKKSLNTGIITVQNYASHVPPKVSHITFAHEVGHNFGSPVSNLDVPHLCTVRRNLLGSYTLSLLLLLTFFSFFLAVSMTLDLSAPQVNPRAKTRKRRAIISCMQEPHRETSSTIISSPSVACATSARCWRKREATVLSVRFIVAVYTELHIRQFKPQYSAVFLLSAGYSNLSALIREFIG